MNLVYGRAPTRDDVSEHSSYMNPGSFARVAPKLIESIRKEIQ